VEAFLPVHAALGRLERERNLDPDPLFTGNPLPYPISIGRVTAGDWASSVPDLLVAEGRIGVRLDEPPEDARTALEDAVADVARRDPWLADHPVEVTWTGGQFASGRIDPAHPLVTDVLRAVRDTDDRDAAIGAAPYGSDLRLYAGVGGIPTLHYGPGDVRYAHAPREQVDVAELLRTTRTLAVLAARRCEARL
jgi:acetylornithine deacetylase